MDCETTGELIQQYHEGEVSLKENRDALAHIKECQSCRESFQKILFDVDLAVYQLVMGEIEPPEDFAGKVIDALPGGEKKSKPSRKSGSSGRLQSVGSGDRKTGARRNKPGSRGALKPVRRTTVIKRRDQGIAESGIFLQDQIFGSQEKKKGLVITYCEECGERINPQDFESGQAVTYKDASYCKNCKSEVMEFIEEDKGSSGSSAKTRTRKPARPAAARGPAPRGPLAAPKKPLNLPLIGGVIMGAAALLIVVVVIVGAMSSGSGSGKPVNLKTEKQNPAKEGQVAGKQDGAGDASAKDGNADSGSGDSVDAQIKAMEDLKRKRQEEEAEAKRRSQVPFEKITAWREEAEKMLEEKGDYEEALRLWSGWHMNARDGKVEDDKAKEKGVIVKFSEEQLDEIEQERTKVLQRWDKHVQAEVEKAMGEAYELSKENKFQEAREKLEAWIKAAPEAWSNRFADHMNRAKSYIDTIQNSEVMWKKRQAEEAARQNLRTITEIGSWVELIKNKDDLQYNWGLAAKKEEGGRIGWDDDESFVTLVGRGTNMVPVFGGCSAKWLDYEVEFQMRAKGQMLMFMRYGQGKKEIRIPFESMPQWVTYRVKVEGVAVELYINGELKGQGLADIQVGPPVFLAVDNDGVQIKNIKVMIKKTG